MLVTAAVFQSAIGPYVVCAVLGSVTHPVTAVPRFASVMTLSAATWTGSMNRSARPVRRCDRNAIGATAHLHTSTTMCCNAKRYIATQYVLHRCATKNNELQN